MPAIGRNDLCPCGSGKKYKKCCIDKAPTVTVAVDASGPTTACATHANESNDGTACDGCGVLTFCQMDTPCGWYNVSIEHGVDVDHAVEKFAIVCSKACAKKLFDEFEE